MYSKKSGRGSLPPRMPAHYSGWAFQPPAPPKDRPPQFEKAPDHRPAPQQEIHQSYPRPLPFLPPPPPEPPKGGKPLPPSLEHLLGKGGLLHSGGLDFEELLLIGLIVLLGSSGEDGELPLLLALLLLC